MLGVALYVYEFLSELLKVGDGTVFAANISINRSEMFFSEVVALSYDRRGVS